MLWQAVQTLLDAKPGLILVIYTATPLPSRTEIQSKVHSLFNIALSSAQMDSIRFVPLTTHTLLDARWYPRFTLLGQSLGSIICSVECFARHPVDLWCDTTGAAFTYILPFLLGSYTVAYTHYPTISSAMQERVSNRTAAHNNTVSGSMIGTAVKVVYYRIFALLYSICGNCCLDLCMANSSWTREHLEQLWSRLHARQRIHTVFPPCDITTQPPLDNRAPTIVCVGQFRPEKNHALLLHSFALWKKETRVPPSIKCQVRLCLIGGVRNQQDQQRVDALRLLASDLGIDDAVSFVLNASYSHLIGLCSNALIGAHCMWNEHFGICIVEYMSLGLVPIVHNSGGPRLDIVPPTTGFLASTAAEYAHHMDSVITAYASDPVSPLAPLRTTARLHIRQFAASCFSTRLLAALGPLLQ